MLGSLPDSGFDFAQHDEAFNVHNITGLLKLYFREMPEPLIPFNRYQDFIAAATIEEEKRKDVLRVLVQSLPAARLAVAFTLLQHLSNVRACLLLWLLVL